MQDLVLIQLSTSDIKNIFWETLQDFFAEKQLSNNSDQRDEIGGIELAVSVTGLAKPTIYALCADKKIPYSKPSGKKLYFSRTALEEWIQSGRRKTQGEIALEAAAYSPKTPRRKSILIR